MGLCNAHATFTTLMNEVLCGLIDRFCTVHLDGVLIFSKSAREHLSHIRQVLERLRLDQLNASPKKCYFMMNEFEFPGVIISEKGLRINPAKTDVIMKWPRLASISEIRGFLGLASFFRRFIQNFSQVAMPLTNLTRKSKLISDLDDSCSQKKEQAFIDFGVYFKPSRFQFPL